MLTNRLRELLESDSAALGIQLRFASPAIAEMAGLAGFDWILIDAEHAPQTPDGIQAQLQAIGCTPATPIVRLGRNDPALIRLYLDMGAMGIVAPFINTSAEARIGADACRYPPRGNRGWGPHRAAAYGLDADSYTAQIDSSVLYFPLIETAEAIENVESIMALDGVDSCIVGPVDLCYSLGIPFQFEHPSYLAALEAVRRAALRVEKPAGLPIIGELRDHENVQRQIAQGSRLLLLGLDEQCMAEAFRRTLEPLSFARE